MHYLLFFLLLLTACSDNHKKQNLTAEYIYRQHNEYFFTPPLAEPLTKDPYPWENQYIGALPRITKEFFRCKGSTLNPVVIQTREGKEPFKHFDCNGSKSHGLPLKEGKEFVYPCLTDILNYIQQKTQKKVVITCGHRCPKHNTYADYFSSNWNSKHMLGAEVDFYVEGMENEPLSILDLIQQYYKEIYPTDPALTTFSRFDKSGLNVSTQPWYNKEIFIKLYLPHEGRDIDNRHPYPYLGIQVRADRDLNYSKVTFDQKASQNYLRH